MLDVIQFHKPVLSYSPFKTSLGNIVKGVETTHNMDLFLKQLNRLLNNPQECSAFAERQYHIVQSYHGISTWRKNIDIMLEKTPLTHSVNLVTRVNTQVDQLAIMTSVWNKTLSKREWTMCDTIHMIKMLYHNIIKVFGVKIYKK